MKNVQRMRNQHRRAVSMKPTTYLRLKGLAESRGTSITRTVEDLINGEADSSCVPIYTRDEALIELGDKVQHKAKASQPEGSHFTW